MEQTDARVAFIQARLDEKERVARRIMATRHGALIVAPGDGQEPLAFAVGGQEMLSEVEALRKLLAAHIGYYLDASDEILPIPTITILAGIWSDPDDYAALFPAEVSR